MLREAAGFRGLLGILIAFNTIEFWFVAQHAGQLGCQIQPVHISRVMWDTDADVPPAGGRQVNSATPT